METIYFLIGALSVTVPIIMGWLLSTVSKQTNQIQQLEKLVDSIVSNDITEPQIRAIVDSRVDKHADLVSREFEKTINYIESLHKNSEDNMSNVFRYIDDTKRDLESQINVNRITNTRRVTDGGLQSEY